MAQTPGQRVYLIRLALGDGVKTPMRIKDFVALIRERTGAKYDPSAISRTENGDRDLALEDVPVIAAVDPHERGRDWLAWGDAPAPGDVIMVGPVAVDRRTVVERTAEAQAHANAQGAPAAAKQGPKKKRDGGKRAG